MRILIVDDDERFATTISRALARRNVLSDVALGGIEAISYAARTRYMAVLIDLRIGYESGLGLIQTIRQYQPNARILIVTGYSSIATAVEAIKLGADDYLPKPLGIADILSALSLTDNEPPKEEPESAPPSLGRLEWEHIQRVLKEQDGNVSATARALWMHRRTLQRKLAKRPVAR